MNASCNKRQWASETAAKRKLAEIRRKRDRSPRGRKVEARVYRCPECRGWHITHQAVEYVLESARKPLRNKGSEE